MRTIELSGHNNYFADETSSTRLSRLAQSFACLHHVPGTRPWDMHSLVDWARSGDAPTAVLQAVAFVLEVADMSSVWDGIPEFNLQVAVNVWSQAEGRAYAAWARSPWFAS